jgi:predicted RNase H-like nuclease
MRAVLGIDAAWTQNNPSGFALLEETNGAWRLRVAASDVVAFARACGTDAAKADGEAFGLDCAERLLGGRLPDLIAVDMPLSRRPIVGRRVADRLVSKRFGKAKCSTHSPLPDRPGEISVALRRRCEAKGYVLATSSPPAGVLSLAEIYPHPALLALLPDNERVEYKVSKTTRYWPNATPEQRLTRVCDNLRRIVDRLDEAIAGVGEAVDFKPSSFAGLKPVEDMVDAIVAAWVGITILDGAAEPFGDDDSAIWIPCAACAKVGATG